MKRTFLVICMSAALFGCGGSGGGGGAPATPIPTAGTNTVGSGTTSSSSNNHSSTTADESTAANPATESMPSTVVRPAVVSASTAPMGVAWWQDANVHFPDAVTNLSHLKINEALGVAQARAQGLDGQGVTVAILDTGLKNVQNYGDRITQVIGTGLVPDEFNQSIAQHGDQVANIAVGESNGIASRANIIDAQHDLMSNTILSNIQQLTGRADIINYSGNLSSMPADLENTQKEAGESDQAFLARIATAKSLIESLSRAYAAAIHQGDALIVQATGNQGWSNPAADALAMQHDPKLANGWIMVTGLNSATDKTLGATNGVTWANACGLAADFCLSAPGVSNDWLSGATYLTIGGTSSAAARVSGAAALLKQKYPWASNNVLRTILLTTADDLGDKQKYGWGMLNVGKAINGPQSLPFGQLTTDVSSGVYSFSNDISGSGSLLKTGSGILNLDGANSFAGGTQVVDGGLNINKSYTGTILATQKGVVGGEGVIQRIVLSDGGTVNFQDGLSTQSLSMDESSKMQIRYGRTAKISGDANLAGTLEVASIADALKNQVPSEIASAISIDGVRTGQFSSVVTPLMYQPSVKYTAQGIDVTMARKTVETVATTTVASVADSVKTAIISGAKQVDKLVENDDIALQNTNEATVLANQLAEIYTTTDTNVLNSRLYSMGGSVYGNAFATTVLQTTPINRAMNAKVIESASGSKSNDTQVFVHLSGGDVTMTPDANVAGKHQSSNLATGAIWTLENGVFGVLASNHQTAWNERYQQMLTGSSDGRLLGVGIFGAKHFKDLTLGLSLSGYDFKNQVKRHIWTTNETLEAVSTHQSQLLQAGVYADKRIQLPQLSLGLNAGARMDFAKIGGIDEVGAGAFALQTEAAYDTTPVILASVQLQKQLDYGMLDFVNVRMGVEQDLSARKAIHGAWSIPRTRANAGAELGVMLGKRAHATLGVSHEHSETLKDTKGALGVSMRF